MQGDIRELLRAQAPPPRRPLDVRAVEQRARTFTRRRRGLIAGGIVAVLGGTPALVSQIDAFDSGDVHLGSNNDGGRQCAVPEGYEADIRIYLSGQAKLETLGRLFARVKALDGVEEVYYMTSEEILRQFKDTYRHQPELWETLGPDSLPATFLVVLADPGEAEGLARDIKERKGWKHAVDDVRWGREDLEKVLEVNDNALPPTTCPRATIPSSWK